MSGNNAKVLALQAQIEKAKKFFPPTPQESRSIAGTVKEVNDATFVIETYPTNPFDQSPAQRTVILDTNTKITRVQQEDQATYQKEFAEFQKALQPTKGKLSPIIRPLLFREIPATRSDIKVGSQVNVTAAENIFNKETFTAIRVEIAPSPPSAR